MSSLLRRVGPLVLGSVLALGCELTTHRLAPFDENAELAARLEQRADAICETQRGEAQLPAARPPKPFRTDGCSASPDGDWAGCCVEHDILYWCGGTSAQRRQADERFRGCIATDHGGLQAGAMYWAVRAGGSAWWPLPWRWGYGWPRFHGYEDAPAESGGD